MKYFANFDKHCCDILNFKTVSSGCIANIKPSTWCYYFKYCGMLLIESIWSEIQTTLKHLLFNNSKDYHIQSEYNTEAKCVIMNFNCCENLDVSF